MQQKSQTIHLKRATLSEGEGTFEGYASVFGNRDLGGDVVQKGAFKKTLAAHGGKFPLLRDHEFSLSGRLGYVECLEDARGLRVKGVFNLEAEAGREAYSHVKQAIQAGMPLGMSFGYDVVNSHADLKTGSRVLTELELYEATITQFPMNPEAGVVSVKEDPSRKERAADRRAADRRAADRRAADRPASAVDRRRKALERSYGATSFTESLASREVWRRYWLMQRAMEEAVENVLYADEMTTEEQREALTENASDYHEALVSWISDLVVLAGKGHLPASVKADLERHGAALERLLKGSADPTGAEGPACGEPAACEEPARDPEGEVVSYVKGIDFFPPRLPCLDRAGDGAAAGAPAPEPITREAYRELLRKELKPNFFSL